MLKICYDLFIQPSMPAPGPRTEEGQWQFEPLAGQTLFQTRIFAFVIWAALISVSILCLRVVCELIVLVFRVSGDFRDLRKFLQQPKP